MIYNIIYYLCFQTFQLSCNFKMFCNSFIRIPGSSPFFLCTAKTAPTWNLLYFLIHGPHSVFYVDIGRQKIGHSSQYLRSFPSLWSDCSSVVSNEVIKQKQHFHTCIIKILAIYKIPSKSTYSKLLRKETLGNHQAYRRGHLDFTILMVAGLA